MTKNTETSSVAQDTLICVVGGDQLAAKFWNTGFNLVSSLADTSGEAVTPVSLLLIGQVNTSFTFYIFLRSPSAQQNCACA